MEFPTEINELILDYKFQLDSIYVIEELKNIQIQKRIIYFILIRVNI